MVEKYIRIHPRSVAVREDRRHHKVQRMIVFGFLFVEERGWYRLSLEPSQWAYLAQLRQKQEDPHTPLVFDIATEAERRGIDERERRERLAARAGVSPADVDLTTRDLQAESIDMAPAPGTPKRGRGRPRTDPPSVVAPKRGRGRPRKHSLPALTATA